MRSHTSHVHGDEPGVGKGIKSGTVGGISEPITHAAQIRAEGSHVIRHLDRCHMNNRNTVGEAQFVRDTRTFAAPKDDDLLPGSIKLADASGNWAQYLPKGATGGGASTAMSAVPQTTPAGFPKPAPSIPRGPGTVIYPDVPQWRRPPPTLPTPEGLGPRLLRWGKWGARFGAVVGALWPTEMGDGTLPDWFHDLRSPDPFRRMTAEEAQRLYNADPALRPDLEEWFREEMRDRPDLDPSTDIDHLPQLAPLPDNVRVDRQLCYPLTLSFTTAINGTREEMQRQLALQQTVLNAKNPCQAASDIARYPINRPIGERQRGIERNNLLIRRANALRRFNPNLSAQEAMMQTMTAAKKLDAIHTLDMVAGGNPLIFSGLGGRSENRSIGRQWGLGGKASQLNTYAIDQCQRGCPRMQTQLVAI